ncbi:MAG: DNA repair protein RecO [Holosporales bacterium]|nr:DNA repair protein RecO [Holosporales bacterium]
MDWIDDVIILSKIPYGESSFVLTVMSENHGKWAGFVKGSYRRQSAKAAFTVFECGDIARCQWRSRVSDNLGNMVIETKLQPFIFAWSSKQRLLAIKSTCDMCLSLCPERQVLKSVYEGLRMFLCNIMRPNWVPEYIRFELGLLKHLGYGLDIEKCAVTGTNSDLSYVSPKTGRAVCQRVGEQYRNRLLALPAFLTNPHDDKNIKWQEVFDGLNLTDFFLQKVFNVYSKTAPKARAMLLQALIKDCRNRDELSVAQNNKGCLAQR